MSFTVRIFGYRGIVQFDEPLSKRFTADAVFSLIQPYEFRQALVSTGLVAVQSAAVAAPDQSKIIRIEVPDQQAIRYEINSPGRNVVADANSPTLSGINQFNWGPGYKLSFIDASGT